MGNTDLIQQLLDLFELLVCQSPRVDAPDLSSKVLKLGRIGSGWEGKVDSFDGHRGFWMWAISVQLRPRYGTCALKLIYFSHSATVRSHMYTT